MTLLHDNVCQLRVRTVSLTNIHPPWGGLLPPCAPDDSVVTVYYRDEERDENVEIARVDTAHGFTHFDRLYRRDKPKDRVEWDFWEAMDHLDRNWRTYAEAFKQK